MQSIQRVDLTITRLLHSANFSVLHIQQTRDHLSSHLGLTAKKVGCGRSLDASIFTLLLCSVILHIILCSQKKICCCWSLVFWMAYSDIWRKIQIIFLGLNFRGWCSLFTEVTLNKVLFSRLCFYHVLDLGFQEKKNWLDFLFFLLGIWKI